MRQDLLGGRAHLTGLLGKRGFAELNVCGERIGGHFQFIVLAAQDVADGIGLVGGAACRVGEPLGMFAHTYTDRIDLLDDGVGNGAHGFGAADGDIGGFLQIGRRAVKLLGHNARTQTEFVGGNGKTGFNARRRFAYAFSLFLDHILDETKFGNGSIGGGAKFFGLNGQGFFDDLHAAEHAFHDLIEIGGLLTQTHRDLGGLIFDAVTGGGEF